MKAYPVFNVEQIEGLPPHFYAPAAAPLDPVHRIEAADQFFANTGADIRHGGNDAYYAAVAFSPDGKSGQTPFLRGFVKAAKSN